MQSVVSLGSLVSLEVMVICVSHVQLWALVEPGSIPHSALTMHIEDIRVRRRKRGNDDDSEGESMTPAS